MCDNCEWQYALEVCTEILDTGESWCEETVSGIKNWIEKNEHVTEKQWAAINNIKAKLEERGQM